MTDADRIRLVEWIGWTRVDEHRWVRGPGYSPKVFMLIPNPEHDANDDYAVLEWARSDKERFSDFKDAMYEILGGLNTKSWTWQYQIGDYARAALKVLS